METKSKSNSKQDLNESSIPLLEMKSEEDKDAQDVEAKDGEDQGNTPKDKKDKKKKEKKEKVKKESTTKRSLDMCAQNFTVGLNVLDRDEKHINDFVNIPFEHLIGEPDPTHGFEFVWRLVFLLFNATRFWFYRIIAAIIAIPLALLWAIIFAFLNVFVVWFVTPALRLFDIFLHFANRIWSGLIRCVLDPFFNSGALLFNNIRTRREESTVHTA